MHAYTLLEAHALFCIEQQTLAALRATTIQGQKNTMNLWCRTFQVDVVPIHMIGVGDVGRFLSWGTTSRNWTPVTLLTHYRHLHVFFAWAVRNKLSKANPLDSIPKPKLPKPLPQSLTKAQARELLEHAALVPAPDMFSRLRNRAVIATFLFTGVRRAELMALRQEDVDMTSKLIRVQHGKGNKGRLIPIHDRLYAILTEYIAARSFPSALNPYFFIGVRGHAQLSDITLRRLVISLRNATGINFHVHTLRHTFATLSLEGGCDLFALSELLGHSDLRTTAMYLTSSAEHLRKSIQTNPLGLFE
jgi:site-specific recombinase XerD